MDASARLKPRGKVSWHSTAAVESITIDGSPAPLIAQREQDAWVYTILLDLLAGKSGVVEVVFDDDVQSSFTIDPQPLVRPETWAVADRDGSCDEPAWSGEVTSPQVIPAP